MSHSTKNIYATFQQAFAKNPAKIGLVAANKNYSFSVIENAVSHLANNLLALGLQPGDRVIVQIEKTANSLFLYLACLKSGFIYIPLNTAYTVNEVCYFLTDAEPRLLVCAPHLLNDYCKIVDEKTCIIKTLDEQGTGSLLLTSDFEQESISPLFPAQTTDIAVILYTSGTTGQAKGAMISHHALQANMRALVKMWQLTQQDSILHAIPLFHIYGLFVACHTALSAGSKLIFLPKFSVTGFFEHIATANIFMGVPTHYIRLLQDPRLISQQYEQIKFFMSGSAPLLPETFKNFHRITGHEILERYGMTETGVNASNPMNGERKIGKVGVALPGIIIRIMDENGNLCNTNEIGEVQISSDSLFTGYWKQPDKTIAAFTDDGFFKTGDLGQFDAEGYLSLVGRSKDLIISGGLNISPKEIEMSLNQLTGISESAVIGVSHPDFGEVAIAVVVGDEQALSATQIITELKQKHAAFKIPKKVFFVNELPKNTMGKVQKNTLRQLYQNIFYT